MFIIPVRDLLLLLINLYFYIILGRIILSFVMVGFAQNRNEIVDNLYRFFWALTEPLLKPIRNLLPSMRMGGGAGIDFSPIILLLLIRVLQYIIARYVMF